MSSNVPNIESAIADKPTAKLAEKEVDSIVLSNISRGLTEDDMHTHFKQFGKVKELKLMQTKSHGFGFVQFMTQEAADKALRAGDYVKGQWGVSRMYVKGLSFHCEREVSAGAEEEEDVIEIERETPNILEVFQIPEDTESFKDKVHQHFAQYGQVLSTRWFFGKNLARYMDKVWKAGGKCTRMLVEFNDGKAVEEAMKVGVARYPVEGDGMKSKQDVDASGDVVMEKEGDTKNEETHGDGDEDDTKEDKEMGQKPKKVYHEVDGSYIGCTPYDGDFKPYKAKEFSMLFIRNISDQITEQDLAKYYKKFGAVNEVMQASLSESENSGVGLVFFRSTKSVRKVMELQGSDGIVKRLVKHSMLECEPVSMDDVPKYKLQRDTTGKLRRARILLNYLRCQRHPCDQHSAPGACTKTWKKHSQGRKHSFTGKYFPDQALCEACMIHFENSEQLANHVLTLRHDVISKHQDLLAEDASWDREEERQTGTDDVHKETNFLRVYRIGDDTSLEEVTHYFTKFGRILSSRWYLPKNVQAERMGNIKHGTQMQIEFEDYTSIANVMKAGLKHQNPGADDPRVLIVDHQIRRNLFVSAHPLEDDITRRANDFRTLFIRTTNTRITEGYIRVRFMKFGEIELLLLGHLNILGMDKRHGIVIFKSTGAVKEIMKQQDDNGRVKLMVKNDLVECEAVRSKETRRHTFMDAQIKEPHMCKPCMIVFSNGQQLTHHRKTMRHEEVTTHLDFIENPQNYGDMTDAHDKVKDKFKEKKKSCPSKLPIYCSTCEKWTNSEQDLVDHTKSTSHKQKILKWDSQCPDKSTRVEKLCNICQIVLPNAELYQDHLFSWMHVSNTDPEVVYQGPRCMLCKLDFPSQQAYKLHQYQFKEKHKRKQKAPASGSNMFAKGAKAPLVKSVDGTGSSGNLSRGSQGTAKWRQQQGQVLPSKLPIYCSICEKWTNSEKVFKLHVQGNKHKENFHKWVSQHPHPHVGVEKLCELCQIVLPNEDLYKDHLLIWMHMSNTDPEDVRQAVLQGSNVFATGMKPPLVESVGGTGSSGDLSRGSEGPAKLIQQQGQMSTAAVSSTGPVSGQTGQQRDKKLSAYQQKRDQITEEFEWSIPDILKANPNWFGEVKGSEFVKPGFNCKVCCKFCAWDREKEGSLSTSRSNHCAGEEHRYRDTMTYQVGGICGTIPGVFCDVCQEFFGFDESQFADVIADHCVSLKHHLHIKLYRLKNNLKLPNWLQRPPFQEKIGGKPSQYKEAPTMPKSSHYPPKSATPRDDTQDNWDRTDYSGQAQEISSYGSYNEGSDQRAHGSDDPESGSRRNRRSLASDNSRSLISNNMRELYQSRAKERKQLTDDSQQYGYENTPGKRTSDGMGYSSFRSQSGSDDGGSYKAYRASAAESSAYRDYEQREISSQGDYRRESSTQGSFRQGSSTGGDYRQDSLESSAYRDCEQRESSTQSDYRHGSSTQVSVQQGSSFGADYEQDRFNSSTYRESSSQGDYQPVSSTQGDRLVSSRYQDNSSGGNAYQESAYPSSSSYQGNQESNMWDNPYEDQGYGEGRFSGSSNAGGSGIDPSGGGGRQDKDVEVMDMDMSD